MLASDVGKALKNMAIKQATESNNNNNAHQVDIFETAQIRQLAALSFE